MIAPQLTTFCLVLAVILPVRRAQAADGCASAYEASQERRIEADLLGARDLLLHCAAPTCRGFIERDCSRWLAEVEAALPTIVVVARDNAGHDLTAVQVRSDGQLVTPVLDARSIPMNPGKRRLTFDTEGFARVTLDLFLAQGQKNRIVEVSFGSPPAPPSLAVPTAFRHPRPTVTYVAAGVTLLGLVGFGALALAGQRAEDSVRQSDCGQTRTCSDAQLADPRRKYLLADVSLAVGILSGVATTLLLSRHAGGAPDRQSRINVGVAERSVFADFSMPF